MGDVAAILGVAGNTGGNSTVVSKKQKSKPVGMSREVFSLISNEKSSTLVPSGGEKWTKSGLKEKRNIKASKWVWHSFKNSARRDGYELKHWVKASTLLNPSDYAFSRFNVESRVISIDQALYDEKLVKLDQEHNWTKAQTFKLLDLCKRFDLRWIVIADRFGKEKSCEDLKSHYYMIARVVDGDINTYVFNQSHEELRKKQLESLFSNETETELDRLKVELKELDEKIRQTTSRIDSRKKKQIDRQHITSEIPSGVYLRSQTQRLPPGKTGLSKKMTTKLQTITTQLGIPERPLPTAPICDVYNHVRQDIIKILSLYKSVTSKESQVMQLKDKIQAILDPNYVPKVVNPIPTTTNTTPEIKQEKKRKYTSMYGTVHKKKKMSI